MESIHDLLCFFIVRYDRQVFFKADHAAHCLRNALEGSGHKDSHAHCQAYHHDHQHYLKYPATAGNIIRCPEYGIGGGTCQYDSGNNSLAGLNILFRNRHGHFDITAALIVVRHALTRIAADNLFTYHVLAKADIIGIGYHAEALIDNEDTTLVYRREQ